MKGYSLYQVEKNEVKTDFVFHECNTLPHDLPISTPLTFPFIGGDIVLCLDKNNWWNPLGGHPKGKESLEQTLMREANEEAGVIINNIDIVGYIYAKSVGKLSHHKYQTENILPITTSFVTSVDLDWLPLETKARGLFSRKEAISLMTQRGDNAQMLQIMDLVFQKFDSEHYKTTFEYHPGVLLADIPITQVFIFCRDNEDKFCIVKDADEDFYSLPGGRCDLGETSLECLHRELKEEAQITCKNIELIGSILVRLFKENVCMSSFQHLRYLADADVIDDFVPRKDGFETTARDFVSLSELESKVRLLQNSTGKMLLEQVKRGIA